jgi:hypothetical protein
MALRSAIPRWTSTAQRGVDDAGELRSSPSPVVLTIRRRIR